MEERKRASISTPEEEPKRPRSASSTQSQSPCQPESSAKPVVKIEIGATIPEEGVVSERPCGVPERCGSVVSEKGGSNVPDRCGSVVSITSTSLGLSYCADIMKSMNDFRENNILCDATICVDGKIFNVHRTILAASSPYFKALFSSDLNSSATESKPIVLNDIDCVNMDILLNYLYTGEIELTSDNVKPIISAANYLLISSLKDRCTKFLQKMLLPVNCLGIEFMAEKFDCESLKSTATAYIRQHFVPISKTDEFLELDVKRLIDIISSDDTKVDREEKIFEAIMNWVKTDEDNRKQHFKNLVTFVRFPLISPYYLMDHVESEDLVRNTPECIALLLEAKNYHMLPDRRWQLKSERTTPRISMGIVNGIIAVGGIQGPCKGLFYIYKFVYIVTF